MTNNSCLLPTPHARTAFNFAKTTTNKDIQTLYACPFAYTLLDTKGFRILSSQQFRLSTNFHTSRFPRVPQSFVSHRSNPICELCSSACNKYLIHLNYIFALRQLSCQLLRANNIVSATKFKAKTNFRTLHC